MNRTWGRPAVAVLTAGTALAGAITGVVIAVGRRTAGMLSERTRAGGHEDPARWRVVTIYRPIEELQDRLPVPLAELGDAYEVEVRQGPDSKGTEVSARLAPSHLVGLKDPGPALRRLRSALRQSKQLAEFGWIHEANTTSTTETTPVNVPLRMALRQADGEGRA
jgi:hypothetical protein